MGSAVPILTTNPCSDAFSWGLGVAGACKKKKVNEIVSQFIKAVSTSAGVIGNQRPVGTILESQPLMTRMTRIGWRHSRHSRPTMLCYDGWLCLRTPSEI